MLTLSNISKSYGGRVLLDGADLQVNEGQRIGLVGPNGMGKSTLFEIILGEEAADSGQVILQRGLQLGYLPQESAPTGQETALDIALMASEVLEQAIRELRDPSSTEEARHDAQARYEEAGGFELEPKAKRILGGLGFTESTWSRPANTLSGGWAMRAHLARLLVQEPHLLMLDEPTNHLDLSSLIWFQNHLIRYTGAILIISHDRSFLNALVGNIVEIRRSKLVPYRGNYDEYLVQKAARDAQHRAEYENQQKEIARLMDFVNRFRAKNTKAAQAQSKLKQIERMDLIEAPVDDEVRLNFRFPQPERSGQRVIRLQGVRHAYGELVVYENLDFELERGRRMVLVGPNGAGKSTLMKLLAGALDIRQGERELGHNVRCAYFSQYRDEMFDTSRTVLEEALSVERPMTEESVRTLLGTFRFRGDDVFKPVKVLSGGEKSRLALVKILLNPPNLLLLDEPTTHLDMTGIEALIHALKQFEGSLVFISHDVYFIRSIAEEVLHVEGGELKLFAGNYDYYLEKSGATSSSAAASLTAPKPIDKAAGGGNRVKTKEQKRKEAEARQARSRELADQRKKVQDLELRISRLETKQQSLLEELDDPSCYRDAAKAKDINQSLRDVAREIEYVTFEWESEAARLQEMEAV